jgi:hypothetical protein
VRLRHARKRSSAALLAAVACGTLGGGLVGAGSLGFDRVAAEAAVPLAQVTRTEVIERAVSWVVQRVPYSQSRWWTDANGTYRQDCSGMVAMAWRLDPRTNYWTGNLSSVSSRIPAASMRPGDILLLPRNHTVIFAGWANDSHTRFDLYEQYRSGHPARSVSDASLDYYLGRGFRAYRYQGIVDLPLRVPLPLAARDRAVADDIELTAAVAGPRAESVPWNAADAGAYEGDVAAAAGFPGPDPAGSGSDLVTAGLALVLLSFPLGVAVRAGAWSPAGVGRRAEEI